MVETKETEKNGGARKRPEYEPTLCERKLLEILLNPEYRLKSVTEICALAGVGRRTYYDCYKKPEFAALVARESLGLVSKAVPAVVNASIRQAKRGDSTHTKIILGMAGLWNEKHDLNMKQNCILRMELEYDVKPPKGDDE
jgi:hypothetical protein